MCSSPRASWAPGWEPARGGPARPWPHLARTAKMGPVSDDLGARLRNRIEDAGPITFAEFMESALYDPEGGFFEGGGRAAAGATVGVDGDFVTSPHVSPLFGTLLSRAVEEARAALGAPASFTTVEVGAGDGAMATPLAAGLSKATTELVLVERTAAHRRLLDALAPALPVPARVVPRVSDLAPGSVVGCVLANEVLDNLPFDRVRNGPNGPVEVRVGVVRGRLTLVETPPSSPETSAAAERLP